MGRLFRSWAVALLASLSLTLPAQAWVHGAASGGGGTVPTNILAVTSTAAQPGVTTGTTAVCAAGSFLFVGAHTASGSITTLTDNSGLGNTYTANNLVNASGKLALYHVKLSANLPIGTTFTFTQNGNNGIQVVADCFPNGTAFDQITSAGALGTSTSPSLATADFTSSPEWVVEVMWSNGQMSAPPVPNGAFVQLGVVNVSGFGTAIYWEKYSGATGGGTAVTFAPTGMSSAVWGLQVKTGTTP